VLIVLRLPVRDEGEATESPLDCFLLLRPRRVNASGGRAAADG
jgi:hypothetical protein